MGKSGSRGSVRVVRGNGKNVLYLPNENSVSILLQKISDDGSILPLTKKLAFGRGDRDGVSPSHKQYPAFQCSVLVTGTLYE